MHVVRPQPSAPNMAKIVPPRRLLIGAGVHYVTWWLHSSKQTICYLGSLSFIFLGKVVTFCPIIFPSVFYFWQQNLTHFQRSGTAYLHATLLAVIPSPKPSVSDNEFIRLLWNFSHIFPIAATCLVTPFSTLCISVFIFLPAFYFV